MLEAHLQANLSIAPNSQHPRLGGLACYLCVFITVFVLMSTVVLALVLVGAVLYDLSVWVVAWVRVLTHDLLKVFVWIFRWVWYCILVWFDVAVLGLKVMWFMPVIVFLEWEAIIFGVWWMVERLLERRQIELWPRGSGCRPWRTLRSVL